MRNKKIVIAGGSGFIGEELIKYFGKENDIVILTRKLPESINNRNKYSQLKNSDLIGTRFVKWDGKSVGDWRVELNNADLVINLAGKSVNCRYTEQNKREILNSRTQSTKAIGEAIQQISHPPKLWINSSSATIYRHATDKAQDEYTGEIKNDFSVQVCKQWEEVFYKQYTPHTRKVALRMAITIGSGGVMVPYFNLLKFGLGGRQGSGKQMYSWIHIEDTCRIIEWLFEHNELEGTFNCSAPNPVTNGTFMEILRKASGTLFALPAYTWMIKLGVWFIGTEAELVLKSRWVVPTKLLETGYVFKYAFLDQALQDIVYNTPKKQYKFR
jgi:uncharacterized protein